MTVDAIYARQSLEKKDSLSIAGQVELCRRYAEGECAVFEDRGYSGKDMRRPAFARLMEEAEAGRVRRIIVYRLDRFSRSIADFSRVWQTLERLGVEFRSVSEQFDTSSPMGRAMLNIIMTFAQLERETTAERVRDNYAHRVGLGEWPGGPAPFGFDTARTRDASGRLCSTLAPNASAETVREIFRMYASPGASLRSVAAELAARGVHGPRRELWDNVTLSRLLHSPVYVRADADVYRYFAASGVRTEQSAEDFDGVHACVAVGRRDRSKNRYNSPGDMTVSLACHEGLIPSELWLSVQRKLSENRQLSRLNMGRYSWLTGLLKCGVCGYAVRITRGRDGALRLSCSGRSNLGCCCASIRVDIRELEAEAERELRKALELCEASAASDRGTVAARIRAADEQIERLVDALADGTAPSAEYISRRIDALHREREALAARRNAPPHEAETDFGTLGFAEKKLLASEFIEKILLFEDSAEVIWRI